MRRLSFPHVMSYSANEYVVGFRARRAFLDPLGEPAHIEEDPHRTAGGRELIWTFERADGLRTGPRPSLRRTRARCPPHP